MIVLLASLLGCQQSPAAAVGTTDIRSCDPLSLHHVRLTAPSSGSVVEDHWLPLVVEAELARNPGLVPRLEPLQPLPGTAWDVTDHEVELAFANGIASAKICTDGFCESRTLPIDPVVPESTAAALAGTIAQELGYEGIPAASVHAPQDDYTRLVAARATAQARGDRQTERDSLERALRMQPMLAPIEWLALRTREDADDRLPALQRLARERGEPLDLAALAEAYDRSGQSTRATATWGQLVRQQPHDGRWRLPAARSALATGDLSLARHAIEGLPIGPEVARMQVELADASGDGADPALLDQWARVAPDDPTPVERLIDERLSDGEIEGALALTDALEERGASEAAATLRTAAEANLEGDGAPLEALGTALDAHASALERARMILADLAHVQNTFSLERFENPWKRCDDDDRERIEQARRLGRSTREAVRDALSARAELASMAQAAHVRPLLDADRRQAIEAILAQSETLPDRYRAAVRIQQDQIEPWSRRCR